MHRLRFWHKKEPEHSWIDELSLVLIITLLLILSAQIRSSIDTNIHYQLRDATTVQGNLPLFFRSKKDPIPLTVTFYVSTLRPIHPSLYRVRADDCLTGMTINGVPVPPSLLKPCRIDTPTDIPLGSYMTLPENVVIASIQDTGGRQGLSVEASPLDPYLLSIHIALIAALIFLCVLLSIRAKHHMNPFIFLMLCMGVIVRLGYAAVTPYNVRANDSEGHLEYIQYVADHWTIPPIHGGWEFYQPPLYYAIAAVPYAALRSIGIAEPLIVRALQYMSVLFSCGVLALCLWMSHLLFSDKQKVERLLWVSTFSVFPGLILLSPRINNDSLVYMMCFGAVALMIAFWQHASARLWYALVVLLSLAVLIKMSAAPLFIAAGFVLLFHPSLSWRTKCTFGFFGFCIALALTEWLFIWRLLEDPNAGMVGNVGNLNGSLRITNVWRNYVTFNPFAILSHPYNNPWADTARRQYFFEFLFRSAYFGEFRSGMLLRAWTQIVLCFGLLSSALAFVGLVIPRTDIVRKALPLWHVFFWTLLGHVAFVLMYPFASSQDFRYSVHFMLPLVYFAIYPMPILPTYWRRIVLTILGSSIVLNAAYIVSLIVTEYTG